MVKKNTRMKKKKVKTRKNRCSGTLEKTDTRDLCTKTSPKKEMNICAAPLHSVQSMMFAFVCVSYFKMRSVQFSAGTINNDTKSSIDWMR